MRADQLPIEGHIYEFGDFRLDTRERIIECAGQLLAVTPKAIDVLIVLVESRGRIVEKEDLMQRVWPGTFVEDNSLAFNVSVLRKLFGESGAVPRYIATVPKRGYRFIGEVTEVPGIDALSPPSRHKRPARSLPLMIGLTALACAVIFVYRFHGPPKLTDKDTLVLAEFANRTGDPVFDETLRQGLAVQLGQSPLLSLISEERIQQVLPLMGQPADARLTPALAREICERTASAAVLEGSIFSLGHQYVLGLRARNCRNGNVLEEEQATAARKEDVLNALNQIAARFRSKVGESLATIRMHSAPLAEATTSSLDALKAYSEARRIHLSTGGSAAAPLYERAIALDPAFSMAYAHLGHFYGERGESDLAAKNTTKAWQLRDHASDAERFFITASYELRVLGNMECAQQTCEAWSRTYPREPNAHGFLAGMVYPMTGKYERSVEEAKKALRLDPDSALMNTILTESYISLNRLKDAADSLEQANRRKLDSHDFLQEHYKIAFLNGDEAEMVRQAALNQAGPEMDDEFSMQQAFTAAYSGHLQLARTNSQRAVDLALQTAHRERAALYQAGAALQAARLGNAAEARHSAIAALALSNDREVEYGAALALAISGDSLRAQVLADDLARRFPEDTSVRFSYLPALNGRLALNHGKPFKSIELLQSATLYELATLRSAIHGFFGALYPTYVRGEARLAAQQGVAAAAEFQKILDHRGIVAVDPIGALAHLQLGRALTMTGDKPKTKIAYESFLRIWKDADPNVSVFQQAKAEYAKLQ